MNFKVGVYAVLCLGGRMRGYCIRVGERVYIHVSRSMGDVDVDVDDDEGE